MTGLPLIEPETAAGPAAALLAEAQQTFGITPNLVKALANSPAALRGYLGLSRALRDDGRLPAATRSRLGLLVAEELRCDYGLSVHSYIGTKIGGLTDEEVALARRGRAEDARTSAVLAFATALVRGRGAVTEEELMAAKAVLTAGEITEVVAQVALQSFADYLALAGRIAVDWPLVTPNATPPNTTPPNATPSNAAPPNTSTHDR